MPFSVKALGGSRGMTLLEVMMAVAVFGIIMAFTTQMSTVGSRISGDNLNQVKMMELAQAEMERVKAEGFSGITDDTNYPIAYPPGATGASVDKSFTITYHREPSGVPSDFTLRIVVGPANAPGTLDPDDPDNFVLVAWWP
ncbi:MAG: type IV pilus modification PilV family protein [Bacillota bacterium]